MKATSKRYKALIRSVGREEQGQICLRLVTIVTTLGENQSVLFGGYDLQTNIFTAKMFFIIIGF